MCHFTIGQEWNPRLQTLVLSSINNVIYCNHCTQVRKRVRTGQFGPSYIKNTIPISLSSNSESKHTKNHKVHHEPQEHDENKNPVTSKSITTSPRIYKQCYHIKSTAFFLNQIGTSEKNISKQNAREGSSSRTWKSIFKTNIRFVK